MNKSSGSGPGSRVTVVIPAAGLRRLRWCACHQIHLLFIKRVLLVLRLLKRAPRPALTWTRCRRWIRKCRLSMKVCGMLYESFLCRFASKDLVMVYAAFCFLRISCISPCCLPLLKCQSSRLSIFRAPSHSPHPTRSSFSMYFPMNAECALTTSLYMHCDSDDDKPSGIYESLNSESQTRYRLQAFYQTNHHRIFTMLNNVNESLQLMISFLAHFYSCASRGLVNFFGNFSRFFASNATMITPLFSICCVGVYVPVCVEFQ
jgi:hypothetical protein